MPCADDLLVVAGEDALIRVGRMTPDYAATQADTDGIQQFRPPDFVVFLRRELGDDEVAVLPKDEVRSPFLVTNVAPS